MGRARDHRVSTVLAAALAVGCPDARPGDQLARDAANGEAPRGDASPPSQDVAWIDAAVPDDLSELSPDASASPDALTAQVLVLHHVRHFDGPPYSGVSAGIARLGIARPEPCDALSRMGPCDLYRCRTSSPDGGAVPPTTIDYVGGRLLVQGLSTDPLTLTLNRSRPSSVTLSAPPYAGRVVTVTGSGDPEGMPAFRISAPAPSLITLRSPSVELVALPNLPGTVGAIRASRTGALELHWTGGGGDPVFVTLAGGASLATTEVALRCSFAGTTGRATLSPEQLRTVRDHPAVRITVETGGSHAFAVGSNVARLILTHYAANVPLVFQ